MNTAGQSMSDAVDKKLSALMGYLEPRLTEGLVVAFSGGVDSAFLAWAAERQRRATGGELIALTTVSESFSQTERADAERFVNAHGIRHVWQRSNELQNPAYAVNDLDRCFHCKNELFDICRKVADQHGLKWLAYGYNASDRSDTRPGHRAAIENSVLSPLAECELTKDDIRLLMRRNGLDLADKPASPCLSSRLMTGVAITPRKLRDVEEIENLLREGGLRVFRVRVHEEGATRFLRLEIDPAEMSNALVLRERLVAESRSRGYKWLTLDLAGYITGGGNLNAK